ncbi:MAG: hypothetical protein R3C28_09195 [Pirellulaceae bacterium]
MNSSTNWDSVVAWQASRANGGTPGQPSVIPGDANHDGVFNSADLVLVFQAGEYEDGVSGNSTFEEGDWNGDVDFNTADFVVAFQGVSYVAAGNEDSDEMQNGVE